ncbi:MAG: hypothetical protein EOO99_04300 [Pedobacter sp.]|nr:MAG: hypothetical protein EOO99_04300 [Pedobacter sp.]
MIKKALLSGLNFLLFSNLFIALGAVAQALLTYQLLGVKHEFHVLAFVFCSTLLIYNLSMLLSKPTHPQKSPLLRVRWIYSHTRLLWSMSLISALCLIPLGLLYLGFPAQILMVFIGLIALGYNVPLFTLNNRKIGLRNLPGIKLFLIAFVWAVSCVVLPILELEHRYGFPITFNETILLVAKRFLFICAITIPFDIRDIYQDKLYELKTLPVLWGEKKAWQFCLALLIAYFILLIGFSKEMSPTVIALSLSLGATAWLIFKSRIERNEYFYFGYLDGTLILQFVLVWIANLS